MTCPGTDNGELLDGHIVALSEGVGNTYIEQINVVDYLCPLLLSLGLLDVTNEVAMGELMSIAY